MFKEAVFNKIKPSQRILMIALNLTTTIDTVDHHHELNDTKSVTVDPNAGR